MSEEMDAATPAEQVTAELGAQVEQQETPEATTEQSLEQEAEKEQPKKEPWFQKRIGELTKEKYEARRQAEEAQRKAQQYEQYLAQLQQGEQQPQAPQQSPQDVMTLAEQIATQKLQEQQLASATDRVWNAGTKELPGFEQAVNNLALVGMDRNFVQLAIESEQAHKVLHYLGQEANLDEAARIMRLNPVQQARELTKLEYKLSQPPAPKAISKAPEPIKPIGTGSVSDNDLRDDLPIEEWVRRRNESLRRK